MFDPIGGFNRMIDQFLSYLETAFRIDDPRVSARRRELLTTPGQLALDPIFEAVPRLRIHRVPGLEGLIDDTEKRLPHFSQAERRALRGTRTVRPLRPGQNQQGAEGCL